MSVSLEEIKSSYDWECTFGYAKGYDRNDINIIIAADNGCNDGDSWIGLFFMNDGKYLYVSAGCDYTGWDCRCWGDGQIFTSLSEAINFGCTQDDRERFGLKLVSG